MIVKDISKLKDKCLNVSVEEGERIGIELLNELRNSKNGIGLAANQIGINSNVCVINVKNPIVLINPKIINSSDEKFIFPEGCLSFPDKNIKTERFVNITVQADNHDSQLSFTAESEDIKDAFECVCVQHEIDHLNGITMFDREFKQKPFTRNAKKIGRNEKVLVKKDDKTKTVKYKKIENMVKNGWELVEV